MDQPGLPSSDGAAILSMMAMLTKLPPPLTQTDEAALLLGDGATIASGWPGSPAGISPPGPPHQLQDAPTVMQVEGPVQPIDTVDGSQADLNCPADSAVLTAGAKAPPEQVDMVGSPPTPPVSNMKEIAFLARLEPNLQSGLPIARMSPPSPNAPEAMVAMVAPIVPALIKARPIPIGEMVQSKTKQGESVTPSKETAQFAPILDDTQGLLLTAVKVEHSDDLATAGPQMIASTVVDRAVATPAPVALPVSVPASLIDHAAAAELGLVEVVLDPKELGKVRFEIHHHGDQVRVFLAVERPETLDLLRRNADQLVQEFRAAGYAGASLNFGHWSGQKGGAAAQSYRPKPEFPVADLPSRPIPTRNFAPAQGLNLRL